ncbi:MAG: DUF3108 domain-containing protein [Methylophilus sp.]|nr:DUF3108 domain-containing protein [Methylophilus sp.]
MSKLNWKVIKVWWLDPTTKRLGYAVLVSAAIHFLFIEQSDWVAFSRTVNPFHTIDAVLVSASSEITQQSIDSSEQKNVVLEDSPQKAATAVAAEPKPPALPNQQNVVEAQPRDDVLAETEPVVTDGTAVETPVSDEVISAVPDGESEQGLSLPEASEEQVKPQPYTMVETDFDVRMNDNADRVGTAKIHYAKGTDQTYELVWKVSATGLLGLVYPDLIQTSKGSITDTGLLPHQYLYKFGSREDKTYQADFNWTDKEVELNSSKGNKKTAIATDAIAGHTQDILSFMYQFMFEPPLDEMQMYLTNGKKLDLYDYVFEGEETLELKFANMRTYHIQHAKLDSEEKTELWLAMDYRYVPVKIRKTEKDGTVIEQIATRLKFETIENETPLP